MNKNTQRKIPIFVDYNKVISSCDSKFRKLWYYLALAQCHKMTNNNQTIINIKIDTSEHTLPINEIATILSSTDTIIKNICIALGYDEQDVTVSLIEAGQGCFLLKIGIFLTSSAIKKYSTGFIEGLLAKDMEKEGKRQAEMIKGVFQQLMTVPKILNTTTKEAQNIKEARSIMYTTFDNNKKIRNVNFTENPKNKISRGNFLDYTV